MRYCSTPTRLAGAPTCIRTYTLEGAAMATITCDCQGFRALTDKEIPEASSTDTPQPVEKFGRFVRSLETELCWNAFEGIQPSARHKSGSPALSAYLALAPVQAGPRLTPGARWKGTGWLCNGGLSPAAPKRAQDGLARSPGLVPHRALDFRRRFSAQPGRRSVPGPQWPDNMRQQARAKPGCLAGACIGGTG